MKNFFRKIKRVLVEIYTQYQNISLKIRDFFLWTLNYKKLKNEWTQEEQEFYHLQQLKVQEKKEHQKQIEKIASTKDLLIRSLDSRIQDLNKQIVNQRNELKKMGSQQLIIKKQFDELAIKYNSIVGKYARSKRTINKMSEDLKISQEKIEYLKTNRRAPTKEELLAFEYGRKEILKRQKNERKN